MNNKINRSICIFLIFTILLVPFSRPKKADAFVLTVGSMALLGLSALALSGVAIYATNPEMLEDIGTKAWNGLKDFYDVTVGENGVVAKLKKTIMRETVQDLLQKSFQESTTITKFESFPFHAGIRPNYDYGTFVFDKAVHIKFSFYNVSTDTKINVKDVWSSFGWVLERDILPNYECTIRSKERKIKPLDPYIDFSVGDSKASFLSYAILESQWRELAGGGFLIELEDVATSLPIESKNDIKRVVDLPYDGSQVRAKDTINEIPLDTTVTVPNVKDLPKDIPSDITDVKDLPVDVDKEGEGTGDGVITGWGWLDNILNKILSAIKAIPGAIVSGISALFVPTLSLNDVASMIYKKFNIPIIDFPNFSTSKPFVLDYDISSVLPGFKIYKVLDWEIFSYLRTLSLGLEVFCLIYFFGKKISALHGGGES